MFLSRKKKAALLLAAVVLTPAAIFAVARGSDHADTPTIAKNPGTDITDVFIFPSPNNPNNVVLAMNVHPLIPSGQAGSVSFDPSVLYQFKIDNNGDNVEDLVIQAKFRGTGPNQQAAIYGPAAPLRLGTRTELLRTPQATVGTINTVFAPGTGIQAFCGAREDPFFFDLNQFFAILPDRASPITGQNVANPNQPQQTTFNGFPGRPAASDFLAGFNVLSIVIELPKTQLVGSGSGKIGVWCTTSK